MDFAIPINWASPFPNLGVSGAIFYFDFIFYRFFFVNKQCRPCSDAAEQ